MATRIKEGMIPYKGWVWIEITENHIINVLLREANNLIHVNENNELYVDLQLDDGIQPDDDFPVGVTTGKILQEDWRPQSWLILNWKTTSWDYARLIYANDWNVYIDCWDWIWRLLWEGSSILNCNTRTFYLPNDATGRVDPDLEEVQKAIDWYFEGKNPILAFRDNMYIYDFNNLSYQADPIIVFTDPWVGSTLWESRGTVEFWQHELRVHIDTSDNTVIRVENDENHTKGYWLLPTSWNPREAFMPTQDYQPTSKKYVDDELAKKQDILTPWTRITIQVDPNTGETIISADVSGVMTYKGNVNSYSDLANIQNPSVWDCWYAETEHTLYAWDGTQWNDVWGTAIDLTNYFNKNVDDSDDITEWSTHLFVTPTEKDRWNNKQDHLTAWDNITIDANNVISAVDTKYTGWNWISINGTEITNDMPFDPWQGSMGQILQKTSDWYRWANFPNVVNSVNGNTWNVTVSEFDPDNAGTNWQVLKKTANGYEWANETAGSYTAWHWVNINQADKEISNTLPFEPTNTGRAWQVIKLNSDWVTYSWQNDESWWGWGWWWGTTYYGWDYISIDSSHHINNTAPFIPTWWQGTVGQVITKTQNWYEWADALPSGDNNVKFWTIDSNNVSSAVLQEIWDWVSADPNNWAVINDTRTKDVFISYEADSIWATFLGKKRITQVTQLDWTHQWQEITSWYEQKMIIMEGSGGVYCQVSPNPDSSTRTNYISAIWANYQTPFMPLDPWEPATKAYVDAQVAWWWVGNAILNNRTGTTTTVTWIWAWTTTELSQISQRDQSCIYFAFNN